MIEPHERHITDTRTALSAQLRQPDEYGRLRPVDLTGLDVEIILIRKSSGVTVVSQTSTGVTVDDADEGKVSYDFSAPGVASAGKYLLYFVVTDSGETDHFPIEPGEFEVWIHSNTQTAQEAG